MITGGLHVRAARNRQTPLATSLRLAALLAAALWHGLAVGAFLSAVVYPDSLYPALHSRLPALGVMLFAAACTAGACLAIASAWFWPRSVTITLALAVAAASALGLTLTHAQGDLLLVRLVGPPLALAALATGKDRPPRTWLWLPGLWLTAAALFVLSANWWSTPGYPLYAGFLVILGISVLWLAVDARPAIAVGLCFEVTYLTDFVLVGPSHTPTAGESLTMALTAAALAGAALRTRRRAIT